MYYAVEDPAKDVVSVEEEDFPRKAEEAAREDYDGDGTLHAREAEKDEVFSYLVVELGLTYAELGDELDTSPTYIGQRIRGKRKVRRLDVLALERLRQLKNRQK